MESKKEVDELIKQMLVRNNENPDSQFEAACLLGNKDLMRDETIDALIKGLSSPQALVRAHAAESLGILEDTRAVPALVKALKDRYRLTRAYAAKALGKLGDPTAVRPLIDVLKKGNEPFFGARAEAVEALRNLYPICEKSLGREIMDSLIKFREEELKEKENRKTRVVFEIDRSLEQVIETAKGLREEDKNIISDEILKVKNSQNQTGSEMDRSWEHLIELAEKLDGKTGRKILEELRKARMNEDRRWRLFSR
jgi:hypothetical protein